MKRHNRKLKNTQKNALLKTPKTPKSYITKTFNSKLNINPNYYNKLRRNKKLKVYYDLFLKLNNH